VDDEGVELLERPRVKQERDTLARGQLSFGVLHFDAGVIARAVGLFPAFVQVFEAFVGLLINSHVTSA